MLLVSEHPTHGFSLVAGILTEAAYRHQTSLIRDIAVQGGRGNRFSYSIRVF